MPPKFKDTDIKVDTNPIETILNATIFGTLSFPGCVCKIFTKTIIHVKKKPLRADMLEK